MCVCVYRNLHFLGPQDPEGPLLSHRVATSCCSCSLFWLLLPPRGLISLPTSPSGWAGATGKTAGRSGEGAQWVCLPQSRAPWEGGWDRRRCKGGRGPTGRKPSVWQVSLVAGPSCPLGLSPLSLLPSNTARPPRRQEPSLSRDEGKHVCFVVVTTTICHGGRGNFLVTLTQIQSCHFSSCANLSAFLRASEPRFPAEIVM